VYANLSTVLEAMEGQLPEDPREALDEAVASMERARLLTQQLLTFSKGGAPTPECVDLRALLEDIARFDVSRPDLRVALPEGAALYAQADRGQIQQVFSNLLINAAQALEGRDDGLIEVAMEYVHLPGGAMGTAPGDFVRVQVRDNGPGIPQDALHRVFDPYFSTKRNGRGLGLAIAHSVVTSHGGHLDVRSPPGQGAELTVLLPRWDGEVPVVGDVRRERDFDPRLIERVLVMDDDEMILRVARRLLTHLGGRVDAVTDGEAAIARFRDARAEGDPYSLVVLDLVVVGGMGGREAVGRLLALDGQARCVVSSGYADDPVVARPRDYGFACALRKPYGIGELRAMLARWPDPSPPSPTAAVAR
jgi:two-component system cell cycle sensor histidine kinase/response regulator CckA